MPSIAAGVVRASGARCRGPAITARAAAWSGGASSETARMRIESVNTRPSNASSPRSRPSTTGRLKVAGVGWRRIERRQLDVGRHHRVGPGGEAGPERDQLDAVEALARMVDDRQSDVRVHVRVAVAREVL